MINILNKLTDGIAWVLAAIAFVFGGMAYVFFKAWAKSAAKVEQLEAENEYKEEVKEANKEAVEAIKAKEEQQEAEYEDFKENVGGKSIADAVKLHNNKVQSSRD